MRAPFVILAMVGFLLPVAGFACEILCSPGGNPVEIASQSEILFLGRIQKAAVNCGRYCEAEVEVRNSIRGELPSVVTVKMRNKGPSCISPYKAGSELYFYGEGESSFWGGDYVATQFCGMPKNWNDEAFLEYISSLGNNGEGG
ncbi:MAG: hypothetical protein KDD70_12860 [Bdellovibrionales bacterium]|nr:hypothetical protein [Bdellovibrionales bacterium]